MKTLLTLVSLLFTAVVVAQQTEGTIHFQEIRTLDIKLPEGVTLDTKIPNQQVTSKVLYFTKNESIYLKEKEDTGTNVNTVSGESSINIKFTEPDNQLFKDLSNSKKVEKQEFFGRTFLIQDELERLAWKLTGNQKKILDFVCQEATLITKEDTVTAWFTPQIPIPNGPGAYGQLPGMILEYAKNGGDYIVKAVEVMATLPEDIDNVLVAPKKGKKVSQAAYNKIVKEKKAEMEKMYGKGKGGSTIVIKEIKN